jgi:putative restriction endonuclease
MPPPRVLPRRSFSACTTSACFSDDGLKAAAPDRDHLLRLAAFGTVTRLAEVRGDLTSSDLSAGFEFEGERIPLINPRRGIFKPQQMQYLLSIKTVFPKSGARIWYDDQRDVHRQINERDEVVDYAFMGDNPDAADNRWLREAMENRVPIIYFLGVAPGYYQACVPTFVIGWDPKALKARVAFGVPSEDELRFPENAAERRYALRDVKHRLHQASFREAVIAAYNGRCALSGLPEPLLLDAAHIIADKDEVYGQPVVSNGITLSKIHHAAFDSQLIGIDPDFRIHVSERLLARHDGPLLETLKRLDQGILYLPARSKDRPDRDRLAIRFEAFKAAA